jgi:hypothetical protein
VRFFKTSIIFFIFAYTPFSLSTNLVNSVSEIPMKVFYHSIPTNKIGQYIEYNPKLLTLRQYDDQGLYKEISIELSGHSNNAAEFRAYLDVSSNAIWVTDIFFNTEELQYQLTAEKYSFDSDGFKDEHLKIVLPSTINGKIQGFNNDKMYILVEYTSSGSKVFNFSEYDLLDDATLKRSLEFNDRFDSNISPSGNFFVTNTGIIDLTKTQLTWIDSGLRAYGAPLFIDNETIIFRDWDVGYFIGSISENVVSTSLVLSNDAPELQHATNGYIYHNLKSPNIINLYDSYYGLLKSFSIDKINNLWKLSDIELGSDINVNSDKYRRTLAGGLINRNFSFTYKDGKWLKQEKLIKGFELDKSYVFVSNLAEFEHNELYSIFTGDINKLKKLEAINETGYQWREIANISKKSGDVVFSFKYQNKIYIFSNYLDQTSDKNDAYRTNVAIIGLDGKQQTSLDLPFTSSANLKANIFNGHFYLTSPNGILRCTIQEFNCDDITPSTTLNGWPQYFNNYIYYYSYSENKLVYYNTKTGTNWNTSTFELPNSSSQSFQKFGEQLRFEDQLIIFKPDGDIDSITPIISANQDRLELPNINEFQNGQVSCNDTLFKCIYIEGQYALNFESKNPNTWERYKKIQGTLFFYDPFEEYHSLEIFRTKDDLIFPEVKEIMPKEIEIWQNDTLTIKLNDYFNNISYYEQESHGGWPEYYNDYIADRNGNLQLLMNNEQTWFEPTISFATYVGVNENFIMPVYPMFIKVKDVNDLPELRAGASLTLTKKENEDINVDFDEIFRDPERLELQYIIKNLPIPSGLAFEYGKLQGRLDKPGRYIFNLTVKDTSMEKLSSDFTFTIIISDKNGNIPSTKSNSSSSGGSYGWFFLIFNLIVFIYRRSSKKSSE